MEMQIDRTPKIESASDKLRDPLKCSTTEDTIIQAISIFGRSLEASDANMSIRLPLPNGAPHTISLGLPSSLPGIIDLNGFRRAASANTRTAKSVHYEGIYIQFANWIRDRIGAADHTAMAEHALGKVREMLDAAGPTSVLNVSGRMQMAVGVHFKAENDLPVVGRIGITEAMVKDLNKIEQAVGPMSPSSLVHQALSIANTFVTLARRAQTLDDNETIAADNPIRVVVKSNDQERVFDLRVPHDAQDTSVRPFQRPVMASRTAPILWEQPIYEAMQQSFEKQMPWLGETDLKNTIRRAFTIAARLADISGKSGQIEIRGPYRHFQLSLMQLAGGYYEMQYGETGRAGMKSFAGDRQEASDLGELTVLRRTASGKSFPARNSPGYEALRPSLI